MTLLFSCSLCLPALSNSLSQALGQKTMPPNSHGCLWSGPLFSLCVVGVQWWPYVEVGALLGHGCSPGSPWQQRGEQGHSPSLSSHLLQWMKDDYSLFWRMVLLICCPKHVYLQWTKQEFEGRGQQGHFSWSRELPGSPFITNEPSVSVTWWWGHMKNPLWACYLQWLVLSIGRDSARCLP